MQTIIFGLAIYLFVGVLFASTMEHMSFFTKTNPVITTLFWPVFSLVYLKKRCDFIVAEEVDNG